MHVDCIIVAPGPSAVLFDPADWPGAVVCALNRASVLLDEKGFGYDWYAAQDGPCLQMFQPNPRVGLIQAQKMLSQFRKDWLYYSEELKTYDPLMARWSEWSGYLGWTGTTAVACMIRMGYNSIVAFGMDWSGAEDWDGTDRPSRSNSRWDNERTIIDRILRGNPQASFRRITMDNLDREALIAKAKDAGIIKRKDTKLSDEELAAKLAEAETPDEPQADPEPVKATEAPPFKPYTFEDLAVNKIAHALKGIVVTVSRPSGATIQSPINDLEMLADLQVFQSPGGPREQPFAVFAARLGPRGNPASPSYRTATQRAREVVERAKELIAINKAHGY